LRILNNLLIHFNIGAWNKKISMSEIDSEIRTEVYVNTSRKWKMWISSSSSLSSYRMQKLIRKCLFGFQKVKSDNSSKIFTWRVRQRRFESHWCGLNLEVEELTHDWPLCSNLFNFGSKPNNIIWGPQIIVFQLPNCMAEPWQTDLVKFQFSQSVVNL
jgi:hypothetical protein